MFAFCILIFNIGKHSKGIHPITINEVTYRLIARTLVIQFRDILTEHFSPHQFGLTIRGDYETMVHGV
jgi:hypothetical protein